MLERDNFRFAHSLHGRNSLSTRWAIRISAMASQTASRDREQQTTERPIATEITPAGPFYEAEEYHQRYFEKQGRAACAVTLG